MRSLEIFTYCIVVYGLLHIAVWAVDDIMQRRAAQKARNEAVFNERKDKFVHRLNRRAF